MKKRFLSLLVAMAMVMSLMPMIASAIPDIADGICGDNLTWNLDIDGVLDIHGTGEMIDFGNNGYDDVPWRNYRNKIVAVVIFDGVTSIGMRAFADCANLERVEIPNSVSKVGEFAFTNTYLYEDENNWIGGMLYIDNVLVEADKEELPENVEIQTGTRIIADWALAGCISMKSIIMPDSVITIGIGALEGCTSLKDITLSKKISKIGHRAFMDCTSITEMSIPDGITYIGINAFYNTPFYNNYDNWRDSCLYINNYLISCDNTSRSVSIDNDTIVIACGAFSNCSAIESVEIPDGISQIGEESFFECISLKKITIPISVKSIGISAFGDCTALTDVYYSGTEAQWNSVTIEENNTPLTNATIHYNPVDEPDPSTEPTTDPSPEPSDEPEPTVDPSIPTPVPAKPRMSFVGNSRLTIGDTYTTSIYLNRGAYYNNGVLNISVNDEAFDLVSEDGFVVRYDNDEGVRTETTIPKTTKLTLDNFNEHGANIVIAYTPIAAGSIYFSAEYTGENENSDNYRMNTGRTVNIVTGAAAEMPEAENTEKLYYTLNGKNVNISLNGTVNFAETTDKNIVVACYDNGALVKTAITPLGASVNGAELNDFTIELPSEPENLIVKAFAWSGFDKCTPLCNASELSDIPADAFKVKGRVTATSRSDWSVDNGRVIFRVEKSDNFDGEIIAKSYDCIENEMYVGNTDIDKHLNEIVEAYIVKDTNDEYRIIKYTPLYEEQTLTLATSVIDLENSTENTLITTEGQEIDISSLGARYVNGVYGSFDNADLLSLITEMSEEYSKITLLDEYTVSDFEGDGKYDEIYLDCYYEATIDEVKIPPFTMTDEETGEDYDVTDEIWVWFGNSDYPIDSDLHIYPYDDWYSYSFINENGEQCGISELKKYEGKEIYIAFDVTEHFSDSQFYDVILEGAEATDNTSSHEGRLSSVNSTVVLRYSDTDNTAFLDGEMSFDGEGNMPFDMTVSYINDNKVISSEIIKSNTLSKRLLFGYESGMGEDYTVTAKSLSFEEKPDKAVISFDEELGIDDINIPIVSKDAYKVCGRVWDTHKTDPEIAANQVKFGIEKTDNFEGEYLDTNGNSESVGGLTGLLMYFGDTNAPDLLRIYSQAFITKNADDDYTIEAIMPFPINSVTLSAENFDADKSSYYNNSLYFYQDGVSNNAVKYVLNDDFEVYVNGVYYSDISGSIDSLINYIDWHNAAKITLIKESWGGSTSTGTYYNLVMIEDYSTAVVEKVTENEGVYTTDFYDCSSDITSSMNIDTTDSEKSYSFKLGDSDIMFSDIKAGDVLSIAYDETGAFGNSLFYDVLVSRDTVSGMCTSSNSSNNEYTFNDVTYKTANGMDIALEVGTEYTLYFDNFGRIALAEENYEANRLAILKNVYKRANGDWYAQIITMEGKEEEYLIDERYATEYLSIIGAEDSFGVSYDYGEKLDKYPQQVVEYRLNSSSQKLRIINSVVYGMVASDMQYEQSKSAIGDRIKFSDDTVILDISDVENGNIKSIATDELVDGRYYTAFGYDHNWRAEEGIYRFVLITGVK